MRRPAPRSRRPGGPRSRPGRPRPADPRLSRTNFAGCSRPKTVAAGAPRRSRSGTRWPATGAGRRVADGQAGQAQGELPARRRVRAEDPLNRSRSAMPSRLGLAISPHCASESSITSRPDRVPFVVVAVEQAGRRPAADLGGQLPGQVGGVLQAEVEALSAGRVVDVRRVPGQQHAPGPVAGRLPGRVADPAQPHVRGLPHAEVGPGQPQRARPQLARTSPARRPGRTASRGRSAPPGTGRRRSPPCTSTPPGWFRVSAGACGGSVSSMSPRIVRQVSGVPSKSIPAAARTTLVAPSQPAT